MFCVIVGVVFRFSVVRLVSMVEVSRLFFFLNFIIIFW